MYQQIVVSLPLMVGHEWGYAEIRCQDYDEDRINAWVTLVRRTPTGRLGRSRLEISFTNDRDAQTRYYPLSRVWNGVGWHVENLPDFIRHLMPLLEKAYWEQKK